MVGGALRVWYNCNVKIKGNNIITFKSNETMGDGGATYNESVIIFQVRSTVKFNDNKTTYFGGVKMWIIYQMDRTYLLTSCIPLLN